MARAFKDQPITRKALILGVVPTITAILLVFLSSLVATYVQARENMVRDLEAESALVADNISAALAFNDKTAAEDTIRAYRAKTNIEAVCIFDIDGLLFASFARDAGGCPPARGAADGPSSDSMRERPIVMRNRPIGSVRITGNFSRLRAWTRWQALVGFGTFAVGTFISFLLTRRLSRYITEPLQHLATTADRVSTSGDYTVRARKTTDDEVGRLVGSFNGMLNEIEEQHNASARLLDREREASRLKDHFLAAVSHELRTPLNAILGWLQILRTTDPDRKTAERALESLERNANAQARVVEDLIEISRVVTGKLQLRTEVVDIRRIVAAAVEVVDPAVKGKGVRLSHALPPDACLALVDPNRLQQVMWNLVSNAVKFTPTGGQVAVNLTREDGEFVVTVRDSGIGISSEFMPFVFDRFRQADGSTTREHGGLGLGLAIAKELTDLHGGVLTATSGGKDQGATFVLRLPRFQRTSPADTGAPGLDTVGESRVT